MITCIISRLLFILILAMTVCPAPAVEKGPQGVARVGVFPFEPLNFIDEQGVAQGLYPDLLREIIKDEKWTVEFVPGSWAEGLERLQKGEIDLILSVAYSPERAEVMDYTFESVAELWGQVFFKPDSELKNINSLEGHRVGIMRKDISGSNFIATAEKFGIYCEIVEFPTHAKVFAAVQEGKVDAGVAPQHFGLRHAKEFNLIGSSIMFSPFSIYFASKKGAQHDLLSHIDAHLSRWKKDPDSFYYERLGYWLGNRNLKTKIPDWLIYASLSGVVSILIFAGFSLVLKRTVNRRTKELQESKEELSNQKKLFETMFNTIPDGVVITNTNREIQLVNKGMEHTFGYTPAELLGKTTEMLYADQESYTHTGVALFGEKSQSRGNRYVTYYRNNGGLEFPAETFGAKLLDEKGRWLGNLGIMRDITERIRQEEEGKLLQKQLNQAQKLEAIGTLAGGIAHDFNNILGAILGYAEMVQEDCPAGSTMRRDIDQVIRASHRAKELIKQILAFSRQTETGAKTLHPASIIREAVKMFRASLPTTIEIEQHIDPEAGPIIADPTQLHQIVTNLCTNAFHAMEESGGILTISLINNEITAAELIGEPDVQPGRFTRLSVGDTGTGIAPEVMKKIFDPYFTTKEVGKGTGMGLAIIHGIVKKSGGFISCQSSPGQGSTFHVFLPVTPHSAPVEGETAPLHLIQPGKERILFVDDEEMLANMGKTMLERLGYTVTITTNSIEALNTIQHQPDQFDLLITDQTMPGMTGIDLARSILQIRPEMPIILCTGFSSIVSEEQARSYGIKGFAMKPLAKKDLADLIRNVLDQQGQ